jgi:hypothetical protein
MMLFFGLLRHGVVNDVDGAPIGYARRIGGAADEGEWSVVCRHARGTDLLMLLEER